MESCVKKPTLVASTVDIYNCTIAQSRIREKRESQNLSEHEDIQAPVTGTSDDEFETNFFKSAQWSADGTTLLTSNADNKIRSFILPPTLLDDPASPLTLTPYTTHTLPTPSACVASSPYFSLSSPTTTLYLAAPNALPIRLQNILTPSPGSSPLASYNLISPTTEAYLIPSSLLWPIPGTQFLTGSDCLIASFDVERSGEGPKLRMPTIPSKRHKMKGGGVGMRGIVSALSVQPADFADGMLAAGTWTRWVGLYDAGGLGGTVATWSIADAADTDAGIGGAGVSQTLWSPCGRYLCVVERMSRGVLVYDVRVTGKLVCWLEGRIAETNQRLGVDVFEGTEETGTEIWAGGTDGIVRVWEGVGRSEGKVDRSWEWKAHDDPVGSTVVHSSGTVVATCSGQRTPRDVGYESSGDESDNEEEEDGDSMNDSKVSSEGSSGASTISRTPRKIPDNSIKVWSL